MRAAPLLLLCVAPTAWAQNAAFYEWDSVFAAEDELGASDMDQNDVVLRHNSRCVVDPTNDLVTHTVQAVAVAAGATRTNALSVRWRSTATPPSQVQLTVEGGSPVLLCDGDCSLTTAVFPDFRQAFAAPSDTFLNTVDGGAITSGVPFVLAATWAPGAAFLSPCDADWSIANVGGAIGADTTFANGRPLVGDYADACPTGNDADCPPLGATPRAVFAAPAERVDVADAYDDFMAWLADRIGDTNGDGTPDGPGCTPGTCALEDWTTRPNPPPLTIDRAGTFPATALLRPAPTCADGVQNADEDAVDCGGTVCLSCVPRDCQDALARGEPEGTTLVQPVAGGPTRSVYCDQSHWGGGWTRIAHYPSDATSPPCASTATGANLSTARTFSSYTASACIGTTDIAAMWDGSDLLVVSATGHEALFALDGTAGTKADLIGHLQGTNTTHRADAGDVIPLYGSQVFPSTWEPVSIGVAPQVRIVGSWDRYFTLGYGNHFQAHGTNVSGLCTGCGGVQTHASLFVRRAQDADLPTDCQDVQARGGGSGSWLVEPTPGARVAVYCDNSAWEGGWTRVAWYQGGSTSPPCAFAPTGHQLSTSRTGNPGGNACLGVDAIGAMWDGTDLLVVAANGSEALFAFDGTPTTRQRVLDHFRGANSTIAYGVGTVSPLAGSPHVGSSFPIDILAPPSVSILGYWDTYFTLAYGTHFQAHGTNVSGYCTGCGGGGQWDASLFVRRAADVP